MTTLLITPLMDISCPGSFGKDCFDMLKRIRFGDWSDLLELRDDLVWSTLLDLCEI